MKTVQRVLSGAILVYFVLASAVSALAEPQNYGLRAVRITSKCSDGLPDIPPPLNTTDPACPGVLTLVDSPSGRWSLDISWFDPNTEKYYLADRNNIGIDIVDARTDEVVGFAGGFVGTNCPNPPTANCLPAPPANSAGPNGVLTTTNPRQLWAGDGNGTVRVYSLDSNGMPVGFIKAVANGGLRRADEMAFDPDDHLVLAAWDDDHDLFVTFISVSNNPTVMGTIHIPEAAGCGIEQPVYNHDLGRFFLAVPCTSAVNNANHNTTIHANGEIAVINPHSKVIEKVFALDGTNCFPHGLALGPRNNLLLGCSGDGPAGSQLKSIIMKATNGAILQVFNQLGGSDEVWFNPGDNHYYLAMSSWTTTGKIGDTANPSLGIINAGDHDGDASFVQNITTTRSSHSLAAVFTDCDNDRGDDHGQGDDHGNGKDHGKADDHGKDLACRNRVYVPLTTVTESGEAAEILEPGGLGVYGKIR